MERLAARLREAEVVPAEEKTHATINRELGDPDDAPTGAVFEFLRGRSLGFIPVMGSRRVRTNLFSSASQNSDRSFMVSW